MTLVLRTADARETLADEVRQVVRSIDPSQPVTRVRTMPGIIASHTGMRRFAATLLTAFALASVVMAVVGLYGSVALLVAQRRREIGVRLALGASAGGIRQLIFSQGLRPVMLGLAAGLGLAALGAPALESLLFGLDARDPGTFVVAAITLAIVGAAACAGPAHRASRIDPATAVRD